MEHGKSLTCYPEFGSKDSFQRAKCALGERRARVEEYDHGERNELVRGRDRPSSNAIRVLLISKLDQRIVRDGVGRIVRKSSDMTKFNLVFVVGNTLGVVNGT